MYIYTLSVSSSVCSTAKRKMLSVSLDFKSISVVTSSTSLASPLMRMVYIASAYCKCLLLVSIASVYCTCLLQVSVVSVYCECLRAHNTHGRSEVLWARKRALQRRRLLPIGQGHRQEQIRAERQRGRGPERTGSHGRGLAKDGQTE